MKKKSASTILSPSIKKFDIRHPFLIPLTTLVITFITSTLLYVFLGGQTVGANDSYIVNLYYDGQQRTVPTRAKTVEELLERLDIQVQPEDIIEPAREAEIDQDNFAINVYKARPITILDGAQNYTTFTAHRSPQIIAKEIGITVYPEDRVITSAAAPTEDNFIGEKLVIERATPVLINLYGALIPTRTHSTTVAELLAEKGITPSADDTITPEASSLLEANATIILARFGTQILTEEVAIESPVETEDDFTLTLGTTKVIDPGVPGRKVVTYEVIFTNGIESSRKVIQEVIVTEPTPKKVAKGRKAPVVAGNKAEIMTAAGISPDEFYAVDFIITKESGWRVNAMNAAGCSGLGQACPGSKLANACPEWQSDPICQMRFFTGYARGRYGSWVNAYNAWQVKGWW